MLNSFVGFIFVGLFISVVGLLFPPVTSAPFGIDTPLQTFMLSVNTLRNLFPWLDTIWSLFIYAILIHTFAWTFTTFYSIVKLIRGGG